MHFLFAFSISDSFNGVELLEYSAVTIPANPDAVNMDFVKGLQSEELKLSFFNDYLIQKIYNDLELVKSDIKIVKSVENNITNDEIEHIKNEIKSQTETIYNKLNDIAGEVSWIKTFRKEMILNGIKNSIK